MARTSELKDGIWQADIHKHTNIKQIGGIYSVWNLRKFKILPDRRRLCVFLFHLFRRLDQKERIWEISCQDLWYFVEISLNKIHPLGVIVNHSFTFLFRPKNRGLGCWHRGIEWNIVTNIVARIVASCEKFKWKVALRGNWASIICQRDSRQDSKYYDNGSIMIHQPISPQKQPFRKWTDTCNERFTMNIRIDLCTQGSHYANTFE